MAPAWLVYGALVRVTILFHLLLVGVTATVTKARINSSKKKRSSTSKVITGKWLLAVGMRKTEITETPLSWGFSKAAASCRTDFCVDHTEAGGDVLWLLAGTEV